MNAWGDTGEKKSFGVSGSIGFTLPRVWKGSCKDKALVVFNFALVAIAKAVNVVNPLLLMLVVNSIMCEEDENHDGVNENTCPPAEEVYTYILFYAGFKFAYEIIHSFREIPFSYMASRAEINIADEVYFHVQSLSLAYHLSRETGKVIRIVSRGSQSFVSILRMCMFTLLGLFFEISMTLIISLTIFSWQFTCVQAFTLIVYVSVTYTLTERRAKGFKAQQEADRNYNQKATDGLLNFETVKYFNAEDHESDRFEKALVHYKQQSIKVSQSLVGLNVSQTTIICAGLALNMSLANWFVGSGALTVGGFVLFIQYNQQIFTPLSFLGTLWRFIRQNMVDVEQILNLL